MRRVAIVGCSGAGKSTLARALGRRTGLPVIHLDRHFWNPGWVETPHDDWVSVHESLCARERWIMDGNFSRTLPARLARADTAVFLDFPTWRCVARVLRRVTTWHGRTRPDLPDGCPEKIDLEFLRWVAGYRRRSREKVVGLLDEHEGGAGVRVVRLRTPREVAAYLATTGRATNSTVS